MKLQSKYFNYILNGSKRVELRLFDEKRKLIEVGDIIKFSSLDNIDDFFEVKVISLSIYQTFDDLFKNFSILELADKDDSFENLNSALLEFYPKEKQSIYGVLAIKFDII